jgi:raffinose/stachyose/melibiose transport system substrate-binding protein
VRPVERIHAPKNTERIHAPKNTERIHARKQLVRIHALHHVASARGWRPGRGGIGRRAMTRKLSRRTALQTSAAATAVFGLSPASAQTTALTFWTWRQEDRAQYAQLFKAFTDATPGISITYTAFEPQSYATVLSTALAAGTGPDVIHIRAYGGTEQFAKAKYLEPLSRDRMPELGNFASDALAALSLRSDGQVYGVPFAQQTLGLFVNAALFEKNGWTPAATWADFHSLCKKIRAAGVFPLANGTATAWMVEVFAAVFTAAFTGQQFAPDVAAGRVTFEDPRYIEALTRLTTLKDYLPTGFTGVDYATQQQLFLSGRAAMFAGGSYEIANFRRQNPNFKMAFLAPPAATTGDPRLVSVYYDGGYAINARSTKTEAAVALLRHLATPAFGTAFSRLLGNISPIRGADVPDPMLKSVAMLNTSSVPYLMAVHFRYVEPTGSTLLQRGIQKLLGGQVTPAEVAKSLTDGIATYFEPFRKR